MPRLRAVVIGTGHLGKFHAQKLASMEEVELAAVVDPSESARNGVAETCHCKAYASCDELFAEEAVRAESVSDFTPIRAAVVAVPTTLHMQTTEPLLQRGIHCLVEKPITPTSNEAERLIQLAHDQDLVLAVGHIEQFNPAWVVLQERLRAPRYIFCRRTSDYTFRSTDVSVVLDVMIHDLELVQQFVGRPMVRVVSQGWSVVGGHEDVARAEVEFDNGCVAVFEASRVRPESVRQMEIWCENQLATIDFATRRYTFAQRSRDLQRRSFSFANLSSEQVPMRQQLFAQHLHREEDSFEAIDALAAEDNDFVQSILEHRTPRTTGESACAAIVLAETVLRNMRR